MNLFIYIPTYNRPNALRKQLTALTVQVDDYKGKIRVLVSDNSSPENVYNKLATYYTNENITFRRNPGNIGANANIALGFTLARADEFLWILSDNDFISDKAIDNILPHLRDDIEFNLLSPNSSQIKDIDYGYEEGWSGYLFESPVGLISNVIHNMKLIAPHIASAFFYHNTSFPHLAVIFTTIKEKGRVKLRILPAGDLFNLKSFDDNQPGNYRLSQEGMPLISPLLNPVAAKKFCIYWLKRHGVDFFTYRRNFPDIHLQTRVILETYGGWTAYGLLFFSWFLNGIRIVIKKNISWLRLITPSFIKKIIRQLSKYFRK